ncbi:LPS export ABC transporter periplasmic protein LptC [Lutimaribacter sp. EGI FJ00015]|uniref:LPS export ABC transporter periplasmic protein LptC n=1 Tax=Lutimaribacter degradans TaxID=2945989 RepID=A0ACC5ZVR6_9RHOB|nr:LPS export ABC transporter periplasmic protein LptC [Lutimaribacter sp. EGI FJ00013]MCM2561861.1 LPS export ABC transporter periplasmic protein LptC [Lutimaribacter sp. EGI FJ00013]MCO0613107.1 LPS export ABC transporter periplasmic protein LptC [Lutimaribacter sp. EGI FJ00015]MCO0635693.1 LPS export ABC transporter periplasmic protein LptC [Lutimaribacter sp. EGI FJ00014]
MSRRDRYYPRLIAWLRIALPIAALGLLSTLFLLSRDIDPTQSIPFSQGEIEERVREQRVTAPNFAGSTERGDFISLTASSAKLDPEDGDRFLAENLSAKIDLSGGASVEFNANQGEVNTSLQQARLIGGAVVTSSTGYRITTEELTTSLNVLNVTSTGPIQGTGPLGSFSAGRMQLESDSTSGHARLLFTNRVKLIYDPQNPGGKP